MRIWKYEVPIYDGGYWVTMPTDAKFRHATIFDIESNLVTLWFEVEDVTLEKQRLFYVIGTGQILPSSTNYQWLATIVVSINLVLHLYERVKL